MPNRVFFPQLALDSWLIDSKVELVGDELTILSDARRYRMEESVHIVSEVTGAACPRDLIGRVKSRMHLLELGAELMEGSMILGENAYDVVAGWAGEPIGSWTEHASSVARLAARASQVAAGEAAAAEPKSDEELLANFIIRM